MNDRELARFLIDNSKALSLKVKDLQWVKEWVPGYSCFHVDIEIDNRICSGSAIDKSKDSAFIKAGSEALERAICYENNIHTNGVAAHSSREAAIYNAKLELLERDAFLCHFYSKTAFFSVQYQDLFDDINYLKIKKRLKETGVAIGIRQMKSFEGEYGFVCISRGISNDQAFSSIIGLGYDTEIKRAAKKALLECLEKTIYFLNSKNPNSKSSPDFHQNYYLDSNKKELISELLKNSDTSFKHDNKLDLNFDIKNVKAKSKLLSEAPILVYKVSSEKLQELIYGYDYENYLNIQRLKNFSQKELSKNDLRLDLHCIG